jgi:hypothetical protein
MKTFQTLCGLFLILILAACSASQMGAQPSPTAAVSLVVDAPASPTSGLPQVDPTEAPPAAETQAAVPAKAAQTEPASVETEAPGAAIPATQATQPLPTLGPDDWQELPVIPETVSQRVYEIYLRGLELGNNPRAFSKIGDCGSTPAWFLGDFDRGPKYYRLGEYGSLEPAIEYFAGSYDRTSLAAKEGFNASSVFTQLWANRSQCEADESPLACEYRVHKPILAFIMLGTNDVWHPDTFEPQMRKIIEFSIDNGVIPVLSTKADNREGDGSVNATIARLAVEYQVPLWNYWLAVQPLPDHGLQEDGAHITWGGNRFDDPQAMSKGWPVRNLNALQMLDLLRQSLAGEE